ncbi:MAG: EamA family transporter [Deltaproteobacteria bacterium]|nr:EamA family transporter [Deltaproteobacteria bacterium]
MNKKAFLFSILTALIWGLAPAFEKIGLRGRIDPYAGVVIRTIPIAIIGIAGLLLTGKLSEIASADFKSVAFVIIGGLLAGFIGQIAFYSALKAGEASVVVPLAATYPLVALLVSIIFLGEAFTWQKLAGIGMIVAGVAFLR